MKRTPLFAFLFFTFLLSFCPNSIAQKDLAKKNEAEILELVRFFKAFVKDLETHKDLNQVSAELFAPNFKTVFAQNDEWISGPSNKEVYKNLSADERFQGNVEMSNFMYLIMMSILSKKGNFEDVGWNDEDFKGILSSQTLKLFRKSKWLRYWIEKDIEKIEPKNIEEWQDYLTDINKITSNFRKELNARTKKEINFYNQNYSKWLGDFDEPYSYLCEGQECFGLPEKTRFFALHAFYLCLRITRINGQFKIVNIYPAPNED